MPAKSVLYSLNWEVQDISIDPINKDRRIIFFFIILPLPCFKIHI